jgi:hypothetical protein
MSGVLEEVVYTGVKIVMAVKGVFPHSVHQTFTDPQPDRSVSGSLNPEVPAVLLTAILIVLIEKSVHGISQIGLIGIIWAYDDGQRFQF